MIHPLEAYLRIVRYAFPVTLALSWLAYRQDISWSIPKGCVMALLGLGGGIFATCKFRGML